MQLAIANSDDQGTGLIDHVERRRHRHGLRAADHRDRHHGAIFRKRCCIDTSTQRVAQVGARVALACRVDAGIVVGIAQYGDIEDLEQRHRRQRRDLLPSRTA